MAYLTKELNDDELKKANGGIEYNGIQYQYDIGTKVIDNGGWKFEILAFDKLSNYNHQPTYRAKILYISNVLPCSWSVGDTNFTLNEANIVSTYE